MKTKKLAVEKKNSTLPADPTVADVKITEDTCCVVTFNLAGRYKDRQSNANTKEEIRKMKASPILDENKKGRFICARYHSEGRKLEPDEPLPKTFYEGSKEYKPCYFHKCYQRRTYNAESLLYLSSPEARPYNIGKKQWEDMSVRDRLEVQFTIEALSMNSINPGITYEFIN